MTVQLAPQLIELEDGTLRELAREFCSACRRPMPDPESGEMCWKVPGQGVFHDRCYASESPPLFRTSLRFMRS